MSSTESSRIKYGQFRDITTKNLFKLLNIFRFSHLKHKRLGNLQRNAIDEFGLPERYNVDYPV